MRFQVKKKTFSYVLILTKRGDVVSWYSKPNFIMVWPHALIRY